MSAELGSIEPNIAVSKLTEKSPLRYGGEPILHSNSRPNLPVDRSEPIPTIYEESNFVRVGREGNVYTLRSTRIEPDSSLNGRYMLEGSFAVGYMASQFINGTLNTAVRGIEQTAHVAGQLALVAIGLLRLPH